MRAAFDLQDKYKVKKQLFHFALFLHIFLCVVFCFGLLLINPSFVARFKCYLH